MPLSKDDSIRTQYQNYGVRGTDTKYGGETAGEYGELRKVEFVFDYNELPSYDSANLAQVLPANAIIDSVDFDVLVAFTSTSGTTDMVVGLADDDGGANITDPNGLATAADLTQAVIAALGRTAGSGAQIGTTILEKSQVTVGSTVADLTAGRARVVVRYTEVPAAQA